MKITGRDFLIFISTFFATIIIDYLFFAGVFTQIPTEKAAWLLDNFFLSILLCFWLFLGMPALVSYLLTFKLFKQRQQEITAQATAEIKKSQTIFTLIVTLVFAILLFFLFKTVMKPRLAPYSLREISESELGEPSPTPSASPEETPLPSPSPTGLPSPTPTPTRTHNPPIINISYPSEMQSIEMRGDQSLCAVDNPVGGDTSGIQRKHNINDAGWSGYTDLFTLCLDPKEGLNRIQLRYKNSFGDESVIYTRQFNFHRLIDISVSISGQIFRDENCSAVRDPGENNISISTIVRMFKMPEFYVYEEFNSSNNGTFNFSTTISEKESLTLQPSVQSPSGYKSNPHYEAPSFTLSSSNRSASLEYPQVPNEFVGVCY